MSCPALMPGSFDPFTVGHFDVALRAAELFGEVVVAVMANSEKKGAFTADERAEICRAAFEKAGVSDAVKVITYNGLLADLYNEVDACCIVKGVRNSNDFVYENDLWLINRSFNSRVETVFLPSRSEYSHISSTMVREMLKYGISLSSAMPEGAAEKALEIYASKL